MVDAFRVVIFLLHFMAAVTVTVVSYTCHGRDFVSVMYVDTAEAPRASPGLWLEGPLAPNYVNQTCFTAGAGSALGCVRQGLPLYETPSTAVGWHVLPLLGHFEWVSSAFALFYVRVPDTWREARMGVCMIMALVGAALCNTYDGRVYWVENLLMWGNSALAAWVLGRFHGASHSVQNFEYVALTGGSDDKWIPGVATEALGPVLRLGEYCVTASELIVAVICVFVVDPPLFIPVLAYAGILCCNLCGVMLHIAVVAEADKNTRRMAAGPLPEQQSMQEGKGLAGYPTSKLLPRRMLRTPPQWMDGDFADEPAHVEAARQCCPAATGMHYQWGDRASFLSNGLMDCWVAYGVALMLVLYQASVLVAKGPPWYVVASGWMLIVSYSSFGIWVTLLYLLTSYGNRLGCLKRAFLLPASASTTQLLENGLDLLSVSAKLSIVGSLVYGFAFSNGVRC